MAGLVYGTDGIYKKVARFTGVKNVLLKLRSIKWQKRKGISE
jgi:hypothetical protein